MPAPTSAEPLHPYYPIDATVVGFVANDWNTLELCTVFAAGCAVIFIITYNIVRRLRPQVSGSDLATVMWFVLCGCIHLLFEGYFAYNFRRMGGLQDIFGQLWKEYSLSDSRYLTQNAFVLCMETITAVCFPHPPALLLGHLYAHLHGRLLTRV
jgi:cholestenol delta-isomerase